MQEPFIFLDSKSSKRSSGLFSVLKWFGNKDSAPSPDLHSTSSSCDSIESVFSTDTVASFAFVPPSSYKPFGTAQQPEKYILSGPETSTYRARLAQREVRRETDRNLTLRSKYNLYKGQESDRGHSLPLMSKVVVEHPIGMHRRTASESSKLRRTGSFCHVKGKRKAPQPPGAKGENTLRRKKRMAPQPPTPTVICNDSLKLDHGILKPAKDMETNAKIVVQEVVQVSPRPWYKRTLSKSSTPEKKPEPEKRKSGLSFLTNISELDREAMEIINKETLKLKYLKNAHQPPQFMRPKNEHVRTNSDSWLTPKRKSARDLIAKFNAITGVSKSFQSETKEAAKEQSPVKEKQEVIIPVKQETTNARSSSHSVIEEPKNLGKPKSENSDTPSQSPRTAVVKPISRSQWNCPKCTLENDYWRIICRVCSTIKPYFDDFTSISSASSPLTETKTNIDSKVEKKDTGDLFDLHKSVFQSHYPRLSQNFNCTVQENPKINHEKEGIKKEEIKKSDVHSYLQPQYPKINLNLNSENLLSFAKFNDKKPENNVNEQSKIEKIILGDELKVTKPKIEEESIEKASVPNTKVEKMILGDEINVETPEYVNVNKYEKIENPAKQKIEEKMILGDEINVKKSPKVVIRSEEEKKKLEEREKLKKMLIEMKNSLPKRVHKEKETEKRVSLIQEQPEPEPEPEPKAEPEPEKTAELIIAATETVYESIKIKHANVDKPVKVSSAAQTNAVLRRNPTVEESTTLQDSKTGFQLMGAKDFAGISQNCNTKTESSADEESHTYANLNMPNLQTIPNLKEMKKDLFAGCSKTDTLEINRLSRRLEAAIAEGQMGQAAVFARELAQLKVPLSVVRQKSLEGEESKKTEQSFNIEMYVEDKVSHRGPFPLKVTETMTVAELKQLVEEKYKIPSGVQRWILGKQLATNDSATLAQHNITNSDCPIFLYLVAPAIETKSEASTSNITINNAKQEDANKVENSVEIVEMNDSEPTQQLMKVSSPNTVYHIPIAIIEEDDDDDDATDVEEGSEAAAVQELWKCQACTLLNPTTNNQCEVCGLIRGEEHVIEEEVGATGFTQSTITAGTSKSNPQENQTYLQLVNLDNEDLVRNVDAFECLVCLVECPPRDGVTLRECLHQFCRACLAHTVEFSDTPEVKCPYRDDQYSCDIALQEREVKALVTAAVYEQHLAKSVQQAENKMDNAFHCKTPDCTGWCIYEDNVNEFLCPVCKKRNCLTCQAIHTGMNCAEYQQHLTELSATDESSRRTLAFLEAMVARGEALACPQCRVLLLKKWGCDWLRCSVCRTEICWATRGPRWGPGGKGDTSAGCKCGVDGKKCHPKCNYCH